MGQSAQRGRHHVGTGHQVNGVHRLHRRQDLRPTDTDADHPDLQHSGRGGVAHQCRMLEDFGQPKRGFKRFEPAVREERAVGGVGAGHTDVDGVLTGGALALNARRELARVASEVLQVNSGELLEGLRNLGARARIGRPTDDDFAFTSACRQEGVPGRRRVALRCVARWRRTGRWARRAAADGDRPDQADADQRCALEQLPPSEPYPIQAELSACRRVHGRVPPQVASRTCPA